MACCGGARCSCGAEFTSVADYEAGSCARCRGVCEHCGGLQGPLAGRVPGHFRCQCRLGVADLPLFVEDPDERPYIWDLED